MPSVAGGLSLASEGVGDKSESASKILQLIQGMNQEQLQNFMITSDMEGQK